jgi:hypothetical protein
MWGARSRGGGGMTYKPLGYLLKLNDVPIDVEIDDEPECEVQITDVFIGGVNVNELVDQYPAFERDLYSLLEEHFREDEILIYV